MSIYADKQRQDDTARLRKCINELEVTARHFKIGQVWQIVVKARNELQVILESMGMPLPAGSIKTVKPWDKPNPMARKCEYCKSQKPGMQPLRLNNKRGYWHLNCFEKAKKELKCNP